MNLDNVELVKQREQIFDEYRTAITEINQLGNTAKEYRNKISEISNQINQWSDKIRTFKALIDIMILEDCDPITAKLKYNEEIQKEIECEKYSLESENGYIAHSYTGIPHFSV